MIFANVTDWTIPEGAVQRVTDSLGRVIWEKQTPPTPTTGYFYVEDTSGSANTLTIAKTSSDAPTLTIYKSTDQVNWTSMGNTSTTGITATVPANGKLYLRCTTNAWGVQILNKWAHNWISCNRDHNVGGNIMSLIKGANFQNSNLDTTNELAFEGLFMQNPNLTSAGDLTLPNYIPMGGCGYMFYECTSLTTAPNLPATTVGDRVYEAMFQGCTSLTTAPLSINAVELPASACWQMFDGCTSLTTPPSIQATKLSGNCCGAMFLGCTSLTTAPALPVTTLAQGCYAGMFYGCTSLTTAPTLPATTLADNCYAGMFEGCTSLTAAPALPATTAAYWCYRRMFYGCVNLTAAPALPATTLAESCYELMFYACSRLATAPVLPATVLATSCYKNMFGGCYPLNAITTYANDISATGCLFNWLYSVAATGDFYNLGTATYPSGISGIPTGWTVHTA